MNERDFMELLVEAIELLREEDRLDVVEQRIQDYRSFEEAMLLTNNTGLVIRTKEAEFQLTIVQSKTFDE